ncbi:unnamed protein product [Orchesella dallaii]|uniref:C2H2-type domain-containing protein n=1 Tax=Orchesella dallaii TaxID=48710 RepID=A0ABP1R8D6_9HEXA
MASEPSRPKGSLLSRILSQGRHQFTNDRNMQQEPSILRNILKFGRTVATMLMTASCPDDKIGEGRNGEGVTSTSSIVELKRIFKPKKKALKNIIKKKKPNVITILSSSAGLHQSWRSLRKRRVNKKTQNVTATSAISNNKKGLRSPGSMKVLLVINPKTRQCPICRLRFPTWNAMRRHCEKHTKPVKCGVCGKDFHKWEHLRQHEGQHFPVHCSYCPKKFLTQDDLDLHNVEYHGLPSKMGKDVGSLFDLAPKQPAPKPYWLKLCRIGEEQEPLNLSCKRQQD